MSYLVVGIFAFIKYLPLRKYLSITIINIEFRLQGNTTEILQDKITSDNNYPDWGMVN